jgi:hypothetical protein
MLWRWPWPRLGGVTVTLVMSQAAAMCPYIRGVLHHCICPCACTCRLPTAYRLLWIWELFGVSCDVESSKKRALSDSGINMILAWSNAFSHLLTMYNKMLISKTYYEKLYVLGSAKTTKIQLYAIGNVLKT